MDSTNNETSANVDAQVKKIRKLSPAQIKDINTVCEKTGWDYETARQAMRKAKKERGILYTNYAKYELYKFPPEKQNEVLAKIKKAKRDADRARWQNKIIEKTGWTLEETIIKYEEAQLNTKCTYEEFFLYKFDELSAEEQKNVFTSNESKKITSKFNTNKDFVNILYDKERSNVYFDKYLGRAWCVNTKISEEEFIEKFSNSNKIFYKPLKGHHGDGAKAFTITPENIKEVYKELAICSTGVVEEFVVQHEEMNLLCPNVVNTIRIVTISSNDHPVIEGNTENIEIVYASQKMGGVNSIVDNLVGGGMVASVNLETGKIQTDAVDENGIVYSIHPATNTKIKGFKIPYFNEAIELVKTVYADKKMEGYLGWDIAITNKGPAIIEINTVPGVILFQLPHMIEKNGMRPYMKKFY